MAMNETEKTTITGLEHAEDKKEAERDFVTALLEAAEFKTDENNIVEAEVKRNKISYFTVHLHPLAETDVRSARKKATIYMPNPANKKLPPIEKEVDAAKFSSWLIYLATTEEDQQKIWGNPAIMQKYGLAQPVESVDVLLTYGEKERFAALIGEISGMDDDEDFAPEEEVVKN